MIIRCSHADVLPISELKAKFHPKNPNEHSEEQLERLGNIFEYQGIRKAAKISKRSGLMTSGHGSVLAAELKGWDKFPVDYQDYDSEEQEYADLVADNAIASWSKLDIVGINQQALDFGSGFDIDLLGIKGFELTEAEKIPGCDEDHHPGMQAETRCKPGDIWILGRHHLMCGDATRLDQVKQLMGDTLVHMVWTDPPYNVDYTGKTKDALKIKNDKMSPEDFRQFLRDAFVSMYAVTEPGRSIYIAHADSEGYAFRGAMMDAGWLVKQCLVWNKNSLVMGRQDYQWKHEPILYGWKEGAPHRWFGDRKQTTVIDHDRPTRSEDHPTMKPVGLIEYFLTNSCQKDENVLDLFAGSGSTLIACEKTNRTCYAMEIDPKYCDVILKRWEEYSGLVAERIHG